MISNIPSSSKGDTGKKSVTEYVEDDVDELTYSEFSRSVVGVFDEIDHRKDVILPLSKSVDLLETLGAGFHSEVLVGHMREVYPNESYSLDRFALMRW